jgi:hypothetical protein
MPRVRTAKKLVAHNKNAFQTAAWFFRDFAVRYAFRLSIVTGLGFAAASLQAAALFGVNHLLARDEPRALPILNITVDHEQAALLGGLFLLGAIAISAVLALIENRMVLDIWRRYQLHALDSLLVGIQEACRRTSMQLGDLGGTKLRRLLRQSQRLGAFSRIVAASIAPALRFIAFSSYAVIANPLLTVALLLAFVPTAGFTLLYFARKASRCARAVVNLSAAEAEELDKRLEQAGQGRYESHDERKRGTNTAIESRVTALTGRLLWVEYSRFLTTIISVVVLGLFFVLMKTTTYFGTHSWASVVIYLIALYIAFRQLIMLATAVSNFGRFYPAATEQKAVLEALHNADSPEEFWQILKRVGISSEALENDDDNLV